MFENLDVIKMANAMSERAGARMGVIARNIANADTPNYRAMDLPSFAESYRELETAQRATRSGHFNFLDTQTEPKLRAAKTTAAPNGNSVSLEQEMVKTADVRQDHEMALAIYRNATEIIRASLGRNR